MSIKVAMIQISNTEYGIELHDMIKKITHRLCVEIFIIVAASLFVFEPSKNWSGQLQTENSTGSSVDTYNNTFLFTLE